MQTRVFFDEVRSWRYPATYMFLVGTTVLGSIGGWLLAHAIVDEHASWGARIFIGGVFGAGFLLLFGICAVVLFFRLLQPPRRVRIDTEGLQLGQRRLDWSQVQCLSFKVTRGEGWLTVRTAAPATRRFLIPGRGLPPATWSELAGQLQRYFTQSALNVEVEISVKP